MNIKIIPQTFITPQGIRRNFGIIINNKPTIVFYSREEVGYFLKGTWVKENELYVDRIANSHTSKPDNAKFVEEKNG